MQAVAGLQKRASLFFNQPRYNLIFWTLLALAVALRSLGLGKSIWLDEASTLQVVLVPDFLQAIRSYDHPPLYLVFLRAWSFFGSSEVFLRVPSVIFGAATVGVVMVNVKQWNQRAALLAGGVSLASPVLLRFSQEIRDYALLALLTALAFYYAGKLIQSPYSRTAKTGLALSLSAAAVTHMVGVFLIPALAVYLACYSPTRRWRNLFICLVEELNRPAAAWAAGRAARKSRPGRPR